MSFYIYYTSDIYRVYILLSIYFVCSLCVELYVNYQVSVSCRSSHGVSIKLDAPVRSLYAARPRPLPRGVPQTNTHTHTHEATELTRRRLFNAVCGAAGEKHFP